VTALFDRERELPVANVFGPTWQGEGPHSGRHVGFVRLGYCDLACTWCDTPETWDHARFNVQKEAPPKPVDGVRAQLAAMDVDTVVLSGGEPLLWADTPAFRDLVRGPFDWHVETNGTRNPPGWWQSAITHTTVSPKLSHSGMPEQRRIVAPALNAWSAIADYTGRVAFKFVVTHPDDLDEVDQLVGRFALIRRHVWVMPEGTTAEDVIATHRLIAARTLATGYNTTTRLHTLLWGNEKGR
jgi:7-carboxy-7-deazaguanine synthase